MAYLQIFCDVRTIRILNEDQYRMEREKDPNMTINGKLDQTQMQLADLTIAIEDAVVSTRTSTRPIDSRDLDDYIATDSYKIQPIDVGISSALTSVLTDGPRNADDAWQETDDMFENLESISSKLL